MELIEQLVTLDYNALKDITFEGESIYELQGIIQGLGICNENIVYKTEIYDSFTVGIKGIDDYEIQKLNESDINNILYEEVLTLDVEYNDGVIIHLNK